MNMYFFKLVNIISSRILRFFLLIAFVITQGGGNWLGVEKAKTLNRGADLARKEAVPPRSPY